MSRNPFFSVVIPIYNKAPHIARSIGSVLSQTFKDFELIIVNDASTDGSIEEVKKFNDSCICLLHREKPGPGGYAARNLGIKEAKGQWIAFLDADDEWYPNHLEKLYELSVKFPEIYFLGCGWQSQYNGIKKENAFVKEFNSNKTMIITTAGFLKYSLLKKQPVWTSVVCIKKTSPVASDLFPANSGAKRGGDRYAWLKMISFHKKMAWSNHIGAIYHQDSVSMVTKISTGDHSLMKRSCYNELSKDYSNEEKKLLAKYFNQQLLSVWIECMLKERNKFRLISKIYWRKDILNALLLVGLSFLPAKFWHLLNYHKKWVTD